MSANSCSQAISRATAAALNCSAACTSGVLSVIPAWAAANSVSACCTRVTVAGGSEGALLGSSLASDSGGVSPAAAASAAVRAACASARSCSAWATASLALTAASPASTVSVRGFVRSAPASLTSPTVGAVWFRTSP